MNYLLNCKQSSRINRVAGGCPGSDDWLDLLNDSVRTLMNRGEWAATVQKITACIYSNCITWPRGVSTPLAINTCNDSIPLVNHWYSFDQPTHLDFKNCQSGCCGRVTGIQGEPSPVFNPISCASGNTGVYLRFYPTEPTDVGKTITVFGIDSNSEELRSQYPDGTYQPGIITELTLPYATMPAADRNVNTMRHVTRILKDETDGPVYAYQYDAVNDVMLDLARYESSETNPWYQTTKLNAGYCGASSAACPKKITALVKLEFIPAVNDNDIVGIDNLDAIAMMMQAIKLGDAYDPAQKRAMEAEAVRELNLELRRRYPIDQIPVLLSPFGTALPGRHGVGRFT